MLNITKYKEFLLLEVREQLENVAGSDQEKKSINDIIEAMRLIDRRLSQLQFEVGSFFTLPMNKHQYDRIIITAGIAPEQEKILKDRAADLLKPGGQLICPYISGPLIVLTKRKNSISLERSPDSFVFVPLIENDY